MAGTARMIAMTGTETMIEAIRADEATVRTAYSRCSGLYDRTIANVEWPAHLAALDRLAPVPGETVIDVAVGPGRSTVELAARVGPAGRVAAVDLSPGMLDRARRRVEAAGATNVTFHEARADRLPFADATADALYNAYMLDLVRLDAMPSILREFHRVLKPGGRLVLLNMSKPDAAAMTMRERVYRIMPAVVTLYLAGGCRPVLMAEPTREAGFLDVRREFLAAPMPSEIVTARR